MPRFRQIFLAHPRLIISLAAGVAVGLATPPTWQPITRVLSGWNIAAWSYLLQMGWLMITASRDRVREIAEREDNQAVVILTVLSFGAVLSLVAIVLELASAKGAPEGIKVFHYVFTALTVLGSWLLVGITYTLHYARIFYRTGESHRALTFPEHQVNPTYWDFLYFSFTIAVAAQTSDVVIMSTAMRKAVLVQSLLSFLFNAAIIGMSINIAAGLVGS